MGPFNCFHKSYANSIGNRSCTQFNRHMCMHRHVYARPGYRPGIDMCTDRCILVARLQGFLSGESLSFSSGAPVCKYSRLSIARCNQHIYTRAYTHVCTHVFATCTLMQCVGDYGRVSCVSCGARACGVPPSAQNHLEATLYDDAQPSANALW